MSTSHLTYQSVIQEAGALPRRAELGVTTYQAPPTLGSSRPGGRELQGCILLVVGLANLEWSLALSCSPFVLWLGVVSMRASCGRRFVASIIGLRCDAGCRGVGQHGVAVVGAGHAGLRRDWCRGGVPRRRSGDTQSVSALDSRAPWGYGAPLFCRGSLRLARNGGLMRRAGRRGIGVVGGGGGRGWVVGHGWGVVGWAGRPSGCGLDGPDRRRSQRVGCGDVRQRGVRRRRVQRYAPGDDVAGWGPPGRPRPPPKPTSGLR